MSFHAPTIVLDFGSITGEGCEGVRINVRRDIGFPSGSLREELAKVKTAYSKAELGTKSAKCRCSLAVLLISPTLSSLVALHF